MLIALFAYIFRSRGGDESVFSHWIGCLFIASFSALCRTPSIHMTLCCWIFIFSSFIAFDMHKSADKMKLNYKVFSFDSFTNCDLAVFRLLRTILSLNSNSRLNIAHSLCMWHVSYAYAYLQLFLCIHQFDSLQRFIDVVWNDDGFHSTAVYSALRWIKST